MGMNLSIVFPSIHWLVRFCKSRALRSFAVAYPKTVFRASAAETFFVVSPMTTASSTS